jgi:hypothetical protein
MTHASSLDICQFIAITLVFLLNIALDWIPSRKHAITCARVEKAEVNMRRVAARRASRSFCSSRDRITLMADYHRCAPQMITQLKGQ